MPRGAAKKPGKSADTAAKADVDRLKESLDDYMYLQGLRWTDKRRLIRDAFFDSTDHITLEELLSRVRAKDPRIGYATVYRTVRLLVQSGVANERRFADGVTSYEPRDLDTHHDHLICLDCGKIVEFKESRIELLQEQLARQHGFDVRYHKHELYCVCLNPDCPERRKKQRR